MKNFCTVVLLACGLLLSLKSSAADQPDEARSVTPVPSDISPVKIDGAKPRNVVFILSDDHRYDAMSFMGHQFAETPNLDQMAKQGVHLKNAFVTTSLCSPSRASILTGLYTFRHRVNRQPARGPQGHSVFSTVPAKGWIQNRLHWKVAYGRSQ